jgi:hypothetical protein
MSHNTSRKITRDEAARDHLDTILIPNDPDGVVPLMAPRELRPVRSAPDIEKKATDKHGRLRWRRLLVGLRVQSDRRSA